MAAKTANVTARIQPNIKEQAEAILERLDIPDKLMTKDTLTKAEFDTMMHNGLVQAKCDDSVSVNQEEWLDLLRDKKGGTSFGKEKR